MTRSTPALPVLDLSAFLAAPTGRDGRDFVARLRDTCHGPGFCYLVGHGVPASLDAAVMARSREFFALPERERRALAMVRQMDAEGFGGCTNYGECHEACPKEIPLDTIARLNRDFLRATLTERGGSRSEGSI